MKNPYQILNINQDADKKEIMKSQMIAMKERKYSLQEIGIAVRQLLDPAKRLAADFRFPAKIKAKLPQQISIDIHFDSIDISEVDLNAFNSL